MVQQVVQQLPPGSTVQHVMVTNPSGATTSIPGGQMVTTGFIGAHGAQPTPVEAFKVRADTVVCNYSSLLYGKPYNEKQLNKVLKSPFNS